MEMPILQLRKSFESRIGQITNIFAKEPPKEIGAIEPAIRGLKGFLFALEGMYRSDYLHGLPFTAVHELNDRLDRAIKAMNDLPAQLNREHAMAVMRVVDNLHRLCLQENLMAGGMDANKLGKLTVILEHKLGEVLTTLDAVAGTATGHTEKVEKAVRQHLADVENVYNTETEVLKNSASLAAESIKSQAEALRSKQADAMKAFESTRKELAETNDKFQDRMAQQLKNAKGVVDETVEQQQTVAELVAQYARFLQNTLGE